MTTYKATPEQWADVGSWAKESPSSWDACLLELRARVQSLEDDSWKQAESSRFWVDALVKRIEALEANSQPTPNPSQIRSSLVGRVQQAIGHSYPDDARAAIREVAIWLMERGYRTQSLLLNDEAER